MEYPFAFSVVMAVYNVELFLREAVDSLVAQDFGFEKIQLILVDDGSTDGSGAICDEYAARYPDNVLVIHKENGGVSSARNAGLPHVQGRYVNFMDADDRLSAHAMRAVADFFESSRKRDGCYRNSHNLLRCCMRRAYAELQIQQGIARH